MSWPFVDACGVADYQEVITEPLYFSSTNFFTSGLW
jgi:hypothetical protein